LNQKRLAKIEDSLPEASLCKYWRFRSEIATSIIPIHHLFDIHSALAWV